MSDEFLKISFDVEPTAQPLDIDILLDNKVIWQQCVDKKYTVNLECQDDITEHILIIRLKNKTLEHTKIDNNGNISEDSLVVFSNFVVDDIDITQVVIDNSIYHHNFNGNGPEITDRFFGTMGCNGSVNFEFSTPFYLWLLEKM